MKKNNTLLKLSLVHISCLVFPFVSLAQDGSLDLTFDADGIVTTPIGLYTDQAYSVAIQSDGKIVVAGRSLNSSNYDFALARYNTNGSLDLAFDADGKVTTPIGTSDDYANAVAIQSDGKIVVAGFSYSGNFADFAVVRYNTNGSLDLTFDADGIVTTPIGIGFFTEQAYTIAIQSDGKIVVAGTAGSLGCALVRYNTNGSLDLTFDTDGIVTTNIGTSLSYARSVAIQSDGKIVVAGYSLSGTNGNFALVRCNTNGSLDLTFDADGIVTTTVGTGISDAFSVAIQSDGKIVVAGYCYSGTFADYALARYNTNGSLDLTFDFDGIVTTPIGTSDDYAYSVAIQSDGKIVVAGQSSNGSNVDCALVRYNTNGSLDFTFDTNGIVTTPIGPYGLIRSLAIQSDAKIVVVGDIQNSSGSDFILLRYNVTIISGINSSNQTTELNIYPNPTNHTASINVKMAEIKNSQLKIFDVFGKEILNAKIKDDKTEIDVSKFEKGIYFVQLFTSDPNQKMMTTKKLIIN